MNIRVTDFEDIKDAIDEMAGEKDDEIQSLKDTIEDLEAQIEELKREL